jgi:hypothetical protein
MNNALREGSNQNWEKLDKIDTSKVSTILEGDILDSYYRNTLNRIRGIRYDNEPYDVVADTKSDNRVNNRGKTTEEMEYEIETTKPIDSSSRDVDKELSKCPYLKSQIIDKSVAWSNANSAQKTNTRGWYNIYGKLVIRSAGNTYIGDRIANLKPWHFGSLEASILEAVPEALFRLKGTEITKISSRGLKAKGKHLVRRGAITGILKKWCYITGIKYIRSKKNADGTLSLNDMCGIKYWAIESRNDLGGLDFLVTVDHAILMLKDFLYLIRDKNCNKLEEYANKGRISNQLYNIIHARASSESTTIEDVITDMKNRLYYDCIINDTNKNSKTYGEPMVTWSFPKIPVEYLLTIIQELSSGKYFRDIFIPLIKNTRLYPIKCSETRVFPIDHETHKNRVDDYDITSKMYRDDVRGHNN